MFDIRFDDEGVLRLSGRFDAAQSAKVERVLDEVRSSVVVDFSDLQYISSAGLGILFAAQKRLMDAGMGLTLVHLNPHIREVFEIAGFDRIFAIE